jgi:DNA-binding LacI/PurR family transcriptional regulator
VAQKLARVIAELNYIPHAGARHLASRRTRAVGFLSRNILGDFFTPLLRGIESVIGRRGYTLLVASRQALLNGVVGGHETVLPLGPHNADGLIVFADSLSDEELHRLYEKRFPVVLIHRTPPDGLPLPVVTVENKAATRALIDHLIEVHGRKRIVFLRGPANQEDSRWREEGYKASLQAHGIKYDPALVLTGGFERGIAYEAMKNLCAAGLDFDAVFAGNDDAAIGVMEALRARDIKVPEEVAVVGFDDQWVSSFLDPPLTTVAAPTEDVGRIAAQRLCDWLDGVPVAELTTLLPTRIVIRRSCGCNG